MPNPTETIGTGEFYTNIQAWEDDLANDDQYTGECKAEVFSNVNFNGVSYTSTEYPHLTVQSGAEHDGRAHEVSAAGNARIEYDGGADVIYILDEFVRVSWLEGKGPGDVGSFGIALSSLNTCTIHIHHNILHNNGVPQDLAGIQYADADCAGYFYRNIIYGYGRGIESGAGRSTSVLLCNTIYLNLGLTGILNWISGSVIENNAVFANTKDIWSTTGVLDYNATSDTTGDNEGANGIADLVTADQFVNPTDTWADTDLLLKTGADLIDEGNDLSGDVGTYPEINVSIDKGATRATIDGTWDIGACEFVSEIGPEILELSGTVTVQSIVIGNIDFTGVLQGSLIGQSTLSAEVKSTKVIAGLVEVQSGATGSLQWLQELAGLIEAQSGVSGSIKSLMELAGSLAAQSTVDGNINSEEALAGSISVQSGAAGSLQWLQGLAGLIDAQSSVTTANLQWLKELAGSIGAQSALTAKLRDLSSLSGSLAAQSSMAVCNLQWLQELAGLIEVQSALAGSILVTESLAGTIAVQSVLTGDVLSTELLTGLIEGQSGATGNLQWLQELAGLIEVQSSVAGNIIIAGFLSLGGSIAAQATLTAKLKEISSLSGSLASQSTVAGNLQWLQELAGSIGVQSGIVGNLQWLQELAGLIEAQSSSAGNILSTEMLAGLIETQSSIVGVLKTIELLTGEVAAQSSLIGYIQLGEITYKVPIITGTPLVTGDVLRWDGSNWVNFAGLMKTKAFSTAGPTDDLDVTGISTLFLDTASNSITIGGFAGGADGQVLYVVRTSNANNVIIEHNEAEATQKIYLHAGTDETLGTEYGGWVFICHGGTDWHDASHAKHVP